MRVFRVSCYCTSIWASCAIHFYGSSHPVTFFLLFVANTFKRSSRLMNCTGFQGRFFQVQTIDRMYNNGYLLSHCVKFYRVRGKPYWKEPMAIGKKPLRIWPSFKNQKNIFKTPQGARAEAPILFAPPLRPSRTTYSSNLKPDIFIITHLTRLHCTLSEKIFLRANCSCLIVHARKAHRSFHQTIMRR